MYAHEKANFSVPFHLIPLSRNQNQELRSIQISNIPLPFIAHFWIYLLSNIISIISSLFVLYFLLFDRHLRRSLCNHVIITLLIIDFVTLITDIPWIIYYYFHEVVWIFTPFFCQTWKFIDTFAYTTIAKLVAWASIERYILIFHDPWTSTRRRCLLLHYLPISIIVIYGITIYLITHYFLSCNPSIYSTLIYCGFYSCSYDVGAFYIFEFVTGGITNSIIIITFSITILVRIVRQKRRVNQRINWRKQRKLVIQLLSITLLFYIFYFPLSIGAILVFCGIPASKIVKIGEYAQFLSYYINFLLPIVCAGTLPGLRLKLKNTLKCCNLHRRVGTIELMPNNAEKNGIELHKYPNKPVAACENLK